MIRSPICAGLVVLAIAVAAIGAMPGFGNENARSILIEATKAMENVKTVRVVYRPCRASTKGEPEISPIRSECWSDDHCFYAVTLKQDGSRFGSGVGFDARALRAWCYSPRKKTLFLAKLDSDTSRVVKIVARTFGANMSGMLYWMNTTTPSSEYSIARKTQDGREVLLITLFGNPMPGVDERTVFEVDPKTKRVFRIRCYTSYKSRKNALIAAKDRIEYDAPIPTELRAPKVPAGVRTEPATVTGQVHEEGYVSLQMKANDEQLYLITAPK